MKHLDYSGFDKNKMRHYKRNSEQKARKETEMNFYKITAVLMLLYVSEAWAMNEEHMTRI
jgi:hypothetical protein